MKKIIKLLFIFTLILSFANNIFAANKIVDEKELNVDIYQYADEEYQRKIKMISALNSVGEERARVIEDTVIRTVDDFASINIASRSTKKEAKITAATITADVALRYNLSVDDARQLAYDASRIATYLFKTIDTNKVDIGVVITATRYMVDVVTGINTKIVKGKTIDRFFEEANLRKIIFQIENLTGPIANPSLKEKRLVRENQYKSVRDNGVLKIYDKSNQPMQGFYCFEKSGCGYMYYLLPDGTVQTGFVKDIAGNTYYLNEAGEMQFANTRYSGQLIEIDESGQLKNDVTAYYKGIWYIDTKDILDKYVLDEIAD